MFQNANLAAATLEDTDLSGAKFTNANLEVCRPYAFVLFSCR